MNTLIARRGARSLAAAVLLSLVLVGQAMAAGWSAPIALTSAMKANTGGLVTLGTSTAVAVYANDARIIVRRSTNSGSGWSVPLRLSDSGHTPTIAGRGTGVDVVWVQGSRIRYARSTNTGASFAAPRSLSPSGANVAEPSVARGANGLVVIAWMQAQQGTCCDSPWNIMARVSTNGGSSFGAARMLGSGWGMAAGAGTGVAYVAFDGVSGSDVGLRLRRSVDGGASWSAGAFFAWPGDSLVRPRGLSMTASGTSAYVAYQAMAEHDNGEPNDFWIQYRRTTNKGNSWSASRNLTSPAAPDETDPVISLKGGVVRAAFARFEAGVWYSQSGDGLTWTTPEQVSVGSLEEYPIGVGHASRPIVLYTGEDGTGFGPYRKDVFVVRGTP